MPLTEEERARIEENRRKAIEKRNMGAAAAAVVTPKAGNSNQTPAINVAKPKAAGSTNSNSFYGQCSRKLSGACSLTSAERFDVKIGYHEAVVAAVKAISSCREDCI